MLLVGVLENENHKRKLAFNFESENVKMFVYFQVIPIVFQ